MSYPISRIATLTPTRQHTPELWRDALEKYADDVNNGTYHSDDFKRARTQAVDKYVEGWYVEEDGAATATGESFTTTGAADGEITLAATTGTDWQGVKAQAAASASVGEGVVLPTYSVSADASGDVVFEARVKLADADADTFFIGLAEAGDVLQATGGLPDDSDYIGFYRLDAGDLQFVSRNDNNGGTAVESNHDVVAAASVPSGSYVKLGFRVNSDRTVEVFIDEERVATESDTGNVLSVDPLSLPIEALCRTLTVARGATGDNGSVALTVDNIDTFVSR